MFLAQQFHDIAPPVDYSLVPRWAIYAGAVAAIVVIALIFVWWRRWRRQRPTDVPTPRERALAALQQASTDIDYLSPYEFSIRISDVLRQYVTDEYQLPLTRQTSVEFLTGLSASPRFSADDKELLDDFLSRCDLIKFARYEATRDDSRRLLEEATRFVKGGALEPVA